jgi:hypothetical protein
MQPQSGVIAASSITTMRAAADGMAEVLDRLDGVLPRRAPRIWESRRPPVTRADLDKLRRAVDPYEVPGEVVAMLRWADGQVHGGPWWPAISCGPLLSAARAAEHYAWLCEETEDWQWNRLWLPVAHEGWYQAGVEMTLGHPGVVLDGSFPDAEARIVAPSLAAMLDVTTQMLESGLPPDTPHDTDGYRRWKAERDAIMDRRDEWQTWPYDRIIAAEVGGWPPHWRVAIGLPAETDAPHPMAHAIRTALERGTGDSEPMTIEGYVTNVALGDEPRDMPLLVTLNDASGSICVLVEADTPGRHWASWRGRRIQLDVVCSPDAQRRVDEIVGAQAPRQERAAADGYGVAREVRVAVQLER